MGSKQTPQAAPPGRSDAGRDRILGLIALFTLCKATLLVVVGLGALELLHPGVAGRAQEWASHLAWSFDRRAVQVVLARVSGLSPGSLEALGVGALLYAALFTVEGIGLWLEKRWAEYLTVIETASFVPFEVHELLSSPTPW